jgi:glycosyltransferase involved in cell wall biosynthesis
MKILYLFLDGTRSPGVLRKVKSKIRFMNNLGLDVTGIFMNRGIEKYSYDAEEKIIYVPLNIAPLPAWFNRRFLRDLKWWFAAHSYLRQFYKQLNQEVDKHPFDLMLFRYPLANKFLYRFARRHRNKIIFEHNSKELVEMNMSADKNPAMRYYIPAEKKYAPKVLSCARAIIGVGNTLVQYQLSRSGRTDLRHTVIPNGIDVNTLPLRSVPPFAGEWKFLLVTGSPSPWVGIDILLNSLAAYRGAEKVHLYIVGPHSSAVEKMVSALNLTEVVTLTGEKNSRELDGYFNDCHVAFGTLAMQRVELPEHSALKVLEYAARGIPFVISYDETNFAHLSEFAPYFQKQEYNGRTLDIEKVISFAKGIIADKNHPEAMRAIAARHFDFNVKMKQLTDFLTELKESRN